MKDKEKENCTEETSGMIINHYWSGGNSITMLDVMYSVNDKKYTLEESAKMKSEAIKVGFLPIGQRKSPVLGNISVGTEVRVKYDPSDPSVAYLADNVGHMNF